jgi:hypothetical protein
MGKLVKRKPIKKEDIKPAPPIVEEVVEEEDDYDDGHDWGYYDDYDYEDDEDYPEGKEVVKEYNPADYESLENYGEF